MKSSRGPVIGPVPPGAEPGSYDRLRRKVLWALPTGLYLLGSRSGEERNMMAVSWVTQVAVAPKLVAVGVEASAVSSRLLEQGRCFTLSLLPRDQRALVRKFVKPVSEVDLGTDGSGTMHGIFVRSARSGAPVVEAAVALLDCEVRHALQLGSHTLFVGEVVDCEGEAIFDGADRPEVLRMEDTLMNYGG